MNNTLTVNLLAFYGLFLIISGVVAVIFIGSRAKTALISGGTSGALALTASYLVCEGVGAAEFAGIFLALALLIVFSWRSTMTLFKLFELIPAKHPDLRGKGVAFLIISLMAIVSLMVLMLQIILLPN